MHLKKYRKMFLKDDDNIIIVSKLNRKKNYF
jgi:hypothetical protein